MAGALIFVVIGLLVIFLIQDGRKPIKKKQQGQLPRSTPQRPYSEPNTTQSKTAPSDAIKPSITVSINGSLYVPESTPIPANHVRWIGPQESVVIAGHTITSGCLYVGTSMSADITFGARNDPTNQHADSNRWYYVNWTTQHSTDPALINPDLPVAARNPDTFGQYIGYWPSYSSINPECRLAYLQWLADGKEDPNVNIGYVFLYLYGLERRIVGDMPTDREILTIIEEVERLRGIYSSNHSFNGYSSQLVQAAKLVLTWRANAELAGTTSAIDTPDSDEIRQLIALAREMRKDTPLSFEWAMVGYFYASGASLRIAATRARAMFLTVMKKRFERKWPEGLKLRQNNLPFSYPFSGANQNIRLDLAGVLGMSSLPDPRRHDWSKLMELAGKVEDDLASYVRALGRDRELATSLAALPLLPADIAAEHAVAMSGPLLQLLDTNDSPLKRIPLVKLVQSITGSAPTALDMKVLRTTAEVLAQLGYGMEPDPAFSRTRPKINDDCVVFEAKKLKNLRDTPSDNYTLATSIAMLVAGVANTSSGGIGDTLERWAGWIGKTLTLEKTESKRLTAHLQWLCGRKLTIAQVTRVLSDVPEPQRAMIAHLAASVAAADGVIEKDEVVFLEKVFDGLGVERSILYGTLHEIAANSAAPAAQPITVERSDTPVLGFRIQPSSSEKNPTAIGKLDMARINKIREETNQVSDVLTKIFSDEPSTETSLPEKPATNNDPRFIGLDTGSTILVQRLLAHDTVERTTFEAAARELGLMPDGVLETINEWAFEHFDEALIEDGHIMEIHHALLQ